jgi:hypothetical protein
MLLSVGLSHLELYSVFSVSIGQIYRGIYLPFPKKNLVGTDIPELQPFRGLSPPFQDKRGFPPKTEEIPTKN